MELEIEDIRGVIEAMIDLEKWLETKGYRYPKLWNLIRFELRIKGGHKISFSIEKGDKQK